MGKSKITVAQHTKDYYSLLAESSLYFSCVQKGVKLFIFITKALQMGENFIQKSFIVPSMSLHLSVCLLNHFAGLDGKAEGSQKMLEGSATFLLGTRPTHFHLPRDPTEEYHCAPQFYEATSAFVTAVTNAEPLLSFCTYLHLLPPVCLPLRKVAQSAMLNQFGSQELSMVVNREK